MKIKKLVDYFLVLEDKLYKNPFLKRKKGRPKLFDKVEVNKIQELYFDQFLTVREIADIFNTNHMTIWRTLRRG